MFLFQTSQVINLNNANTDVNLYTAAGQPKDVRNVFIFNNASVNSSSSANPALRTGTGWKGGSTLYLKNSNTI